MSSVTEALARLETHGGPLSADDIRAQINLIQEVMRGVMKVNIHFGTIPGTTKPTLYKAGAEKLLSTFRIAVAPIFFFFFFFFTSSRATAAWSATPRCERGTCGNHHDDSFRCSYCHNDAGDAAADRANDDGGDDE